jgi:cation:H+ antiporter|tara:strand:- start:9116 stop:10153 length:1038 start_codon:yes stop_codon:yes gene_type:complete
LFNSLPLIFNLLIFAVLAIIIWTAGTRLSYFIDAIAEQTKIARAFLGLILLAVATELPEFVTTLTASSTGKGSLALNNMFGGMMLQLAVLAIADIFVKSGTLSSKLHKPTVAIAGLLCITSLSAVLIIKTIGDPEIALHIGAGSMLVTVLYIISMYILYRSQGRETWSPVDLPEDQIAESERKNRFDTLSLSRLIFYVAIAGLAILLCGVLLVRLGDTLAAQTGLGTSFVGASLLALTTSLPELSTSIAAVRVKAYTMAISNVFGSNMIMTFLLFPNDLVFTDGPIINVMDPSAIFAVGAGIFMTAIYCIGLLARPKIKTMGMGVDSLTVLSCYFAGLFALYLLR